MYKKTMNWALIALLGVLAILLTSCGQEAPTPLSTIVPNLPATPVDRVDLSKYPLVQSEPDPDGARLFGVSFGAEGIYIDVSYTCPPELAKQWIQGDIFVIDEKSGTVFRQVALVPRIGWLFQRPIEQGQYASVMLVNSYHGFRLEPGSVVTVVMGKYRREHIEVNK